MKPIRRAAKCLIIENGKIVITKYLQGRKVGYYDIPGGKIEDGEYQNYYEKMYGNRSEI